MNYRTMADRLIIRANDLEIHHVEDTYPTGGSWDKIKWVHFRGSKPSGGLVLEIPADMRGEDREQIEEAGLLVLANEIADLSCEDGCGCSRQEYQTEAVMVFGDAAMTVRVK